MKEFKSLKARFRSSALSAALGNAVSNPIHRFRNVWTRLWHLFLLKKLGPVPVRGWLNKRAHACDSRSAEALRGMAFSSPEMALCGVQVGVWMQGRQRLGPLGIPHDTSNYWGLEFQIWGVSGFSCSENIELTAAIQLSFCIFVSVSIINCNFQWLIDDHFAAFEDNVSKIGGGWNSVATWLLHPWTSRRISNLNGPSNPCPWKFPVPD